MPSSRTILAASVLALASIKSVAALQIVGCYDSSGDLKNFGTATYQTQGACDTQCSNAEDGPYTIFAVTQGSTCYCGNDLPSSGLVDNSQCNRQCQGYNENCGGDSAWLFGYIGTAPSDVPLPSSSTGSSSSKATSTSKTSVAIQTTVIIQSPATVTAVTEESNISSPKSAGASKAGIAAGVVVGLIAIIALCVGGFLLVRKNRRQREEEEYKAAVAAKEFTASIRKPALDSRLDPVIFQHRRMSDGSIADNQDFSRRILKVTNPDGV